MSSRVTVSLRSPYPDFYAMNLVFARAPRIAIDPVARVVIGITPASHGYLYFNHRESDAMALLNTAAVDPEIRRDLAHVLRPGTNMNTSWLLAMEALWRRLGSPADMRPDYDRYQRLQALFCVQAYYLHRTIPRADLAVAEAGLTRTERWAVRLLGPVAGGLLRNSPPVLRRWLGSIYDRIVGQYSNSGLDADREVGRYRDVLEVFDQASARPLATHQ